MSFQSRRVQHTDRFLFLRSKTDLWQEYRAANYRGLLMPVARSPVGLGSACRDNPCNDFVGTGATRIRHDQPKYPTKLKRNRLACCQCGVSMAESPDLGHIVAVDGLLHAFDAEQFPIRRSHPRRVLQALQGNERSEAKVPILICNFDQRIPIKEKLASRFGNLYCPDACMLDRVDSGRLIHSHHTNTIHGR
jgi:hypothetical protein